MFSRNPTLKYTTGLSEDTKTICEKINDAGAVLIGAGAGLSAAAGFDYSGKRFYESFGDFIKKYGFRDMYSGGFFDFPSREEYWAYWSRYIYINRYRDSENGVYARLFELVKDKDYFVITTNVDHQFQKAGFDKKRLFYTQGDYGLFQCSEPCHNKTYDNRETILKMVHEQKNMKVPSELIPKCPVCGKPMTVNLRCDDRFVQDDGWYGAADRYDAFVRRRKYSDILFLELGVGMNTPVIIKYPFWQMTAENPNAFYVCVNSEECVCPYEIQSRSLCVSDGIEKVI